jgi:hypothetical protein
LTWTRDYLTTEKMATYLLQTATRLKVNKVLFLSGEIQPDYQRCLTLHGLKMLLGKNCFDYPKITHLYKDYVGANTLYGKGMTYSNLLDISYHEPISQEHILKEKYDLIIYGSAHRGMPFYRELMDLYKPEDIVLMCGEDDHYCSIKEYSKKGHKVFIRELY